MLEKVLFIALFAAYLLACTAGVNGAEKARKLKQKINKSDKIEISVIPDRNSGMSFKALEVTEADKIAYISRFVVEEEPQYPQIFASLPDGYLSLYENGEYKMNVYFVLDSLYGTIQILEERAEFKINHNGIDYLRKIYSDHTLWEPKEDD